MAKKHLHAQYLNTKKARKESEEQSLLREFRSHEQSAPRFPIGSLCTLLAFLALAALTLYVLLTASRSTSGSLILPAEFPIVALLIVVGYSFLTLLLLGFNRRSALTQFRKQRHAHSTDTSTISLFKEKIDLPYVVTDAEGKIIVANRAFESAVADRDSSVGENIREICTAALDQIIRSTAAESETDQKVADVHAAALRAFPEALHRTATTDACLALLKEIDALSLAYAPSKESDPDSPLLRVHEIASGAFREAEKRSALWNLCLGTLETILSSDVPNGNDREKLAYIYRLARDAYTVALEKENEILRRNAVRDFTESLEKIVLAAETDSAAGQLSAAFRLRLEMFRGKNLFPHLRTLLLNIRQILAQALPDPSVVTDDKDTITLQAILKTVDEGITSLHAPQGGEVDDRTVCKEILSAILQTSNAAGEGSTGRAIRTIRGIADAALCALLPERSEEYIALVTRELLLATAERKDISPVDAEIHRIASELQESIRNGNREDEERFIASFRDAVQRIAEESRLHMNREGSEEDRIHGIIERAVSGCLSFLEIRTVGSEALSRLLKHGDETLNLRDINKNDQKLISHSLEIIRNLKEELLGVSEPTPQAALTCSAKFSKTLSDLLSRFDEKADYSSVSAADDERPALARTRMFYAELEQVAALSFPLTVSALTSAFYDRAAEALSGHRLYTAMMPKMPEMPTPPEAPSSADLIPEVSDKAYAARQWSADAHRLLFHIGALRVYAAEQPTGTLSDLLHIAESIYERISVRRILVEVLVFAPEISLSETDKEGATDESLYQIASAYFRGASTHRSRILIGTCRAITTQALSFLDTASDFAPLEGDDEEIESLAQLRTEIARSRSMLLSHSGTSEPEELIALSESIFNKCAARLEHFAKKDSVTGIYHAALTFLSEFFADLNGKLLRREFFHSYRNTSAVIVSRLYRAEYTLAAISRIRTISEDVLASADDHTVSFSGLSLKECCSSDLRTIAGLSGIDVIAELTDLSDAHAEEALAAKSLWELRKQTLFRIGKRLDLAEEYSTFHDKSLVPHRNEISRIRKAVAEGGFLESGNTKGITPEAKLTCRDKILAELPPLRTIKAGQPSASGIETAFNNTLDALLNTAEAPLSEFLARFKPFYQYLNRISKETLSYRRNKKRILALRQALAAEETMSFIPETGAPLSRQRVYELFSKYLDTTLRTVRPGRENNPAMNDIYHIVLNTQETIEDDSSPYFRLFAASSLSRIARLIDKAFSAEQYEKIMPALSAFLQKSAKAVSMRELCPTQEGILRISTLAFREADALYRLGEIAGDSQKVLSRISADAAPAGGDVSRIYNTIAEIRQKIETCAQSVPHRGATYALFCQLDAEAKKLHQKYPYLEKDKYTTDAVAAMIAFLHSVSELASPYLFLNDSKDAAALRSEVSRIRRNVREVSEASSSVGSRATAASALAAISQYACTFEKADAISAIADAASAELSEIPEKLGSPERIYSIAIAALSRIISESPYAELRTYATEAMTDLSERRTICHFLVTAPIERLNADFHDPTDPEIYLAADAHYRTVENSADRFRIELLSGILHDSLTTIRGLTDPGTFSRIRSVSKLLRQSVDEFEAALRALPVGKGEAFIPPVLLAKAKQLQSRFELLFTLAKEASAEYRKDPERAKISESLTLIICEGLITVGGIVSGKGNASVDALPSLCKGILNDVIAALNALDPSDAYLSDIRQRTDNLISHLTFPSIFDKSVSTKDCVASFNVALRKVKKEMNYIPTVVQRFREETPGASIAGSLPLYRCEAIAQNLLSFLAKYEKNKESLTAASLCCAVAGHLAQRAKKRNEEEKSRIIAIYDAKGNPSGQNNTAPLTKKRASESFCPIVQNKEETYHVHGLAIANASVTPSECVTIGGARYIARSYPHRSGGHDYYLVTFTSVEETLSLKQACEDENTVVALISLDNLEELAQYVRIDHREAEKEVEKALRTWAGTIHGIFHEYERDKYILFFSQKELIPLVNSKFSDILTTLENIRLGDSSVSVTISMGLSALGDTLTMKEQNASLALDMALKRGGAQIVIFREAKNQEGRYEFLSSNRVKGLQKENRVGARVVANYLCELIRKSGNVLVMGHAYPDFDSIGSCVGIAALARYYKKEVHVVVNRHTRNFRDCTPDLLALPEYQNVFIDGTTGMELKGTDTLLILCDVSNTNIMESRDIARTSFNTVIIDHHFKTTDSDDLKTHLTYIDPSASSASELVAEILEEVLPKDALRKEEANLLLSGIMVDTKNFTRSVGARTFAAALYLRQMGANAEISSTYFYEQNGDYKAEVIFRKNLDFHKTHREVAITFCSQEDLAENPEAASCDLRVAASKAADKLLTVRGIRASFALYPYAAGGVEGIAISGRSDGSINVQQILEAFKGGGHFDSAGANLPGRSVDEVIKALEEVLDEYFLEDEEKAADDTLD